jgi:hypothetical protein
MDIILVYRQEDKNKNISDIIEKKISINQNITIKEIKQKYFPDNKTIILMYCNKILKDNDTINSYINPYINNVKYNNKIYCINTIKRKIISIKIDLSFYINKSIIIKVYNDITIKEIKSSIINYLKNYFPFLNEINENIMVSFINNNLQDDTQILFDNLYNKPFKLFLQLQHIQECKSVIGLL